MEVIMAELPASTAACFSCSGKVIAAPRHQWKLPLSISAVIVRSFPPCQADLVFFTVSCLMYVQPRRRRLMFHLSPSPSPLLPVSLLSSSQVRKTLDATMQTLQDMLTVEDFDVSDAFQHSRSTESIKSVASESYMSKMNVAKRRANQQETEIFYFSVSPCDL